MAAIHCVDAGHLYKVSLRYHIPGKGYCDDVLCDLSNGFESLMGFTVARKSVILTTQAQFDVFQTFWTEEVANANAGRPTTKLQASKDVVPGKIVTRGYSEADYLMTWGEPRWEFFVDGTHVEHPYMLSWLEDDAFKFVAEHSVYWPCDYKLLDEIARRAGMKERIAEELRKPYPKGVYDLYLDAADKLGLNLK